MAQTQLTHRLKGITRAFPIQFQRRDFHFGYASGGNAQHFQPLLRGCRIVGKILVGGNPIRDQQKLVQFQSLDCLGCRQNMPDMRGVKRAAINADSFHILLSPVLL